MKYGTVVRSRDGSRYVVMLVHPLPKHDKIAHDDDWWQGITLSVGKAVAFGRGFVVRTNVWDVIDV